jgi:metal-sulfur cluster biosynthetic enzyme
VSAFARAPLVVLTGGDPLRRADLVELVAHGTARGLSVSLTPGGTICPSGFLPSVAGNVRRDDLVAVYREHALFTALGDPPGEDPGCAWRPAGAPARAIAGGSDAPAPTAVTRARVVEALRGVLDPELGMSVVELGLVYGIAIEGGDVRVTLTLTAPGCPVHDVMPGWIRRAVGAVPGVERVEVLLTFDPPWTPERIGSAPPA